MFILLPPSNEYSCRELTSCPKVRTVNVLSGISLPTETKSERLTRIVKNKKHRSSGRVASDVLQKEEIDGLRVGYDPIHEGKWVRGGGGCTTGNDKA